LKVSAIWQSVHFAPPEITVSPWSVSAAAISSATWLSYAAALDPTTATELRHAYRTLALPRARSNNGRASPRSSNWLGHSVSPGQITRSPLAEPPTAASPAGLASARLGCGNFAGVVSNHHWGQIDKAYMRKRPCAPKWMLCDFETLSYNVLSFSREEPNHRCSSPACARPVVASADPRRFLRGPTGFEAVPEPIALAPLARYDGPEDVEPDEHASEEGGRVVTRRELLIR
jgi:hypothetical protein